MRAGGCALQQALTAEAAGLIKQAVVLAKRRGHAQVTPLHVANTMLAASNGLLRLACLESHSHPLQCKALELCFNVALNRLPASSSSNSLVGSPHHHSHQQYPSISNALVAAFKRAQAHHRRGTIENHPSQSQQQQQSILAVKIELEQLIISILDDPSVSRVMREAGFSSTQVKTNVEKAVLSSSPPPPPLKSKENKSFLTLNPTPDHQPVIRNEDVNIVIETLLKRTISRKSLVLVGESISTLESTVKGVMGTVDKGGVPDSLREVKFITIPPLYSFCNLRREEVDQKIGELTCLVDSLVGKGVILYLGDLKWISDYRVSLEQERNSYYCSVEHMIMELGRLVWRGINDRENEKFWLMGIATFQTYMKCRSGYNSLETVWGLHPVTIPANTLGFSLVAESDEKSEDGNKRTENRSSSSQLQLTNGDDVKLVLSCCSDCSAKLEAEVRNLDTSVCRINGNPTLSSLPYWLKDECTRLGNNDQNYDDSVREIHKKWNKFCSSSHKKTIPSEGTLITSSSDQDNPYSTRPTWTSSNGFGSNPSSSTPNSASSSDVMDMEYTQRFKEFNAENLNIICNALEKKVPCQREIIPEIAGTILQSRSGMLRRRKDHNADVCNKEETWLFFLGGGAGGARDKEKISRELARIVFGSYSSFVSIGLISSFVSSENCRTKRGRDEQSCMSYMDRFARAVAENPHRVFLVEDLEQVDCSKMGIKRAIERGRLAGESGEEVDFCDAIIILSCDSFGSRSRRNGVAGAGEEETTANRGVSLDLNLSLDDGDSSVEDHESVDDVGILEYVDRRVVFKIQDL